MTSVIIGEKNIRRIIWRVLYIDSRTARWRFEWMCQINRYLSRLHFVSNEGEHFLSIWEARDVTQYIPMLQGILMDFDDECPKEILWVMKYALYYAFCRGCESGEWPRPYCCDNFWASEGWNFAGSRSKLYNFLYVGHYLCLPQMTRLTTAAELYKHDMWCFKVQKKNSWKIWK